jgi:predicted outer membrane repeat protein
MWRNLFRSRRTQKPVCRRPGPKQFRPALEALEDRLVPAGTVMNTLDAIIPPVGSLRWACQNGGLVNFANGLNNKVIHLTAGEIYLNQNTIIDGSDPMGNPRNITINGTNRDRIFEVAPCTSVTIQFLTLTDGYARVPNSSGRGGAILNEGDLALFNDTFTHNWGWFSGGAIDTETSAGCDAALSVVSCMFHGNKALTGFGGAISTDDPQQAGNNLSIIVYYSSFEDNNAALGGGAIDFDAPAFGFANLHVEGSTFEANNTTKGGGGAIDFDPPVFASGTAQMTVQTSTFEGNDAVDGGAIYCHDNAQAGTENIDIDYSSFDSNHTDGTLTTGTASGGYGGAIDFFLDLSGNAVATANIIGGDFSHGVVTGFTGNQATYGGAISTIVHTAGSSTAVVTIEKVEVSSNLAVWGGGIYQEVNGQSTNPTTVKVTHSTVDDNAATSFQIDALNVVYGRGGGIFANVNGNANTFLGYVNDTIAFNSAVTSTFAFSRGDGGGLYLAGANPAQTKLVSLNSLTVAYNYADNDGGGLYVDNSNNFKPDVRNCAFDLNFIGAGFPPDVFGSVNSQGWNLLTSVNASFSMATHDGGAADLGLSPALAINGGGPTLTLQPLMNSLALGNSWFGWNSQTDDPLDDQNYNPRGNFWTNCGAVGP